MAKQHEIIGEELDSKIVVPMGESIKEKRSERAQHFNELGRIQNDLANTKKKFEDMKKTYDKRSKEAMDAQAKYIKADNDINMTKAKVNKVSLGKRRGEGSLDCVSRLVSPLPASFNAVPQREGARQAGARECQERLYPHYRRAQPRHAPLPQGGQRQDL